MNGISERCRIIIAAGIIQAAQLLMESWDCLVSELENKWASVSGNGSRIKKWWSYNFSFFGSLVKLLSCLSCTVHYYCWV